MKNFYLCATKTNKHNQMKKYFLTLFTLTALLFSSCSGEDIGGPNRQDNETVEPEPEPEIDDDVALAGMEFVADMGVGWNLGNTLDAHDSETSWGNPYTTKEMIDIVAAKGFKTMRVPVTWQFNLGDGPDYLIKASWLDRVEQIVNYGLKNNMYVIINLHHDEEIIEPSYAKEAESTKILVAIWKQVSERFIDYGNKLIFETLNEMRVKGSAEEWQGGSVEGRNCINNFHEAAVAAIRATGGNNETRKIMLSTYAASTTDAAMNALELPDDDNIIVAVHSYTPYAFCLKQDDPTTTWGTDSDKAEVDALFSRTKSTFIDKGHPVVMGEWGSMNHDNDAHRAIHAAYYAKAALNVGVCPVVWDDGGWFELLDRDNLCWKRESIANAIVNAQN